MNTSILRRFWDQERGFTLLEVVLAVFIVGTVVVGSVVVIGTVVRTASSSSESLNLQQLVQAQIETIQQVNFIKHPPPTLDASNTYPPLVGNVGEVEVPAVDDVNGITGVKVSFPLIDPLADPDSADIGITISFLVSDSGTNYEFPQGGGLPPITNVVQRIDVTASDAASSVTLSFYKISVP